MDWMLTTVMAVETSILPPDMCIMEILYLILKVMIYGLGVAATVGMVVAGVRYMTARDNESQVANAKKQLLEIVIGLVAWALMWTMMNWLIPGGMSFTLDEKTREELCPEKSSMVMEDGTEVATGAKATCRL